MSHSDSVLALAPCGLDCSRCFAHRDGEIRKSACSLRDALGQFDSYAERFSAFIPEFSGYTRFKAVLSSLANGDCPGCRQRTGECLSPGCNVPGCTVRHGVDFCAQCEHFPCGQSGLTGALKDRWESMNRRIQQIGPEAYCRETMERPRYQ